MRYVLIILTVSLGALGWAQQQPPAPRPVLRIVHGLEKLGKAEPVVKMADDTRGFVARVAYDEQNLYVLFDVMTPNELVNSFMDWHTLFKGGNCLDIQLAADPAADPARKEPAVGDLRVLVTRQGGKTVTVIYRPKVKDFKGQPIVFNTVNTISFDSIERDTTVELREYHRVPQGFSALVALPLTTLGWTPKSGTTVKMDLGYRFGNSTGNQICLRTYWSTNSFNSNVVYDVPCESRLEPDLWGMAMVE